MSHLSSEVLRRYLDDTDSLLSYEKQHLLSCPRCRGRLDDCRHNACVSAAAFSLDDTVDIGSARTLLSSRLAGDKSAATTAHQTQHQRLDFRFASSGTARWGAAAIALAALAALFMLTPLKIYAQNFLTIFQPQQFHAVGLTATDISRLRALPDLADFGSMQGTPHPHFSDFNDPQKAAKASGIAVAQAAYLPASISAQRTYHVSRTASASFTFSAAKTRAFARRKRITLPPMPSRLDGATLTASVGPVIVQIDGRQSTLNVRNARNHRAFAVNHEELRSLPADAIIITQAHAPKIVSSGATVPQIESYLLSIPGVPADLATQIRAIRDLNQTVPVPFRIDKETAQKVSVQGTQGLLVGDNTGVGSGVMWEKNGTVYGVAGPFAASEILKVANALKI